MKKFENITDISDNTKQNQLLISLPFLSKQASKYEKLVWTAKAIHILSKNEFQFNTENKENIANLDKLLLKYFREKKIQKIELIKSDDKREKHLLENNSIREFSIKCSGLLINFFPYVELLVQHDLFKNQTEYIDYFNNILNKETTVNLYYELSLFEDYLDNPFISKFIEDVYKFQAENYHYYHVFIKDNKIHYQQKQIESDRHFEKLKLSYFQSCISKLERKEVRDTACLDINEMLETRLQRLSVKRIKYEYFQNKIDFDLYFKKVLKIFDEYQLLDLEFKQFNALSLIKFISGSKMRFYRANEIFCSFYDPCHKPIQTIYKEQPQVLLIGSKTQGTGKTSFVQNLFFNYLQKNICPSLDPQISADIFNKKHRQQDISFKLCKDFMFAYLGDIRDFNMDILKDVVDKDKITYTRLYSDKGTTHNIALNFFGTLNEDFKKGGLNERLITKDYGNHRRLLFCLAPEKQASDKEKLWFDKVSKTPQFQDDMDFIMSYCPVGWDWMLNKSHDDITQLVKEHNYMQELLQSKNSKKSSEEDWIKEVFDFFGCQWIPNISLLRIAKEKHGYHGNSKSFGILLSNLGIENKLMRFIGYEYDELPFSIKQDIAHEQPTRCRLNKWFDLEKNKSNL